MNASEVLGGPLAQAIGLALLHLLWQGAIVASLLAAGLALLARSSANTRYMLSCAALALLLGFGVVTAIRSYDAPIKANSAEGRRHGGPALEDSPAPSTFEMPAPTWRDSVMDALATTRQHTPQIVLVWLAGVLLLTTRLAVSWSRARALTKRLASPASAEWQAVITRLSTALRLRRAVELMESAAVEVPSVIGWIRPVILIPASGLTGFTPQQIEMIFAHELAHIRRHDFLVNVLQSLAETLLFYHPAAWWISRRIRIERENCCDDLAVSVCGNALQYARALTQLEQLRAAGTAVVVGATGGSLFERVRRIVGKSERHRLVNGWTAAAAALAFAAVLSITTLPANAVAPRDQEAPPPTPPVPATRPVTPRPAPKPMPAITVTVPAMAVQVPNVPDMANAVVDIDAMDFNMDMDIDTDFEMGNPDDDQEATADPSGKLTIDELISLRVSGITPEYIESMRKTFGAEVSIRDLSSMRLQGVTADYVREMRALFGPNLTARDITALKVQGVSATYVSEMKAAGVELKTARDATSLRVHGVTPAFVKSLRDAGYEKITARDLSRLAAAGVNADFIRQMSKYRKDKK